MTSATTRDVPRLSRRTLLRRLGTTGVLVALWPLRIIVGYLLAMRKVGAFESF